MIFGRKFAEWYERGNNQDIFELSRAYIGAFIISFIFFKYSLHQF